MAGLDGGGDLSLPAATVAVTRQAAPGGPILAPGTTAFDPGTVFFETMEPALLLTALNQLFFDFEPGPGPQILPAGATRAVLKPYTPALQPGRVMVIERDPAGPAAPGGKDFVVHAVRVTSTEPFTGPAAGSSLPLGVAVTWDPEDALPQPIRLDAMIAGTPGDRRLGQRRARRRGARHRPISQSSCRRSRRLTPTARALMSAPLFTPCHSTRAVARAARRRRAWSRIPERRCRNSC